MNEEALNAYADTFLPIFTAAKTEAETRDAVRVLVKHVEREARNRAARQVQACMSVVGESGQHLNV